MNQGRNQSDATSAEQNNYYHFENAEGSVKPHWDSLRRQLRYGGMVVKHFHKPAPNQELILATFEELGWPPRIDDPLPPQGEIVPSVRLHDTLGRLNRTLQNPILHFGSDGAGRGVVWKLRADPPIVTDRH